MTATMYYLRQQTRVSGPFTVEQLKSLLHRGRVARSDKISIDKSTWLAIAECTEIMAQPVVQAHQPAGPAPEDDGIEWFYTINGAEQPGPVSTVAMKGLIAAGTLTRDELVWRQGFEDWRPVLHVEQFVAAFKTAAPAIPSFPTNGDSRPARRRATRKLWWGWWT